MPLLHSTLINTSREVLWLQCWGGGGGGGGERRGRAGQGGKGEGRAVNVQLDFKCHHHSVIHTHKFQGALPFLGTLLTKPKAMGISTNWVWQLFPRPPPPFFFFLNIIYYYCHGVFSTAFIYTRMNHGFLFFGGLQNYALVNHEDLSERQDHQHVGSSRVWWRHWYRRLANPGNGDQHLLGQGNRADTTDRRLLRQFTTAAASVVVVVEAVWWCGDLHKLWARQSLPTPNPPHTSMASLGWGAPVSFQQAATLSFPPRCSLCMYSFVNHLARASHRGKSQPPTSFTNLFYAEEFVA